LSGALFPLDSAPKFLKIISVFNPLTYGIDALRSTLVNVSHFRLMTDFLVLSGLTILIFAIGAYLFSKIEV
jgi:ABC-2 type transport system permease protein